MSTKEKLEGTTDYKDTLNLPRTDFPMKGDGPRREPEIQKFWFEKKIYEKALNNRKDSKKFLLHDGPPYLSSGNIHIGTALNKILKDIVVKFKTISGYYAPYLPGFDCHGLPIESAVLKNRGERPESRGQKELTPLEIRKECTEFVIKNRKSQEEKFKRLGVLGDWDNSYMTINPKFEAVQLKLFGEMVKRGYISRGLKPVYWCATCKTALAEAEVEYVDEHKSPSIYVSFEVTKLSSDAKKLEKFKNLQIVVWTTTPWTIPGNLAICLNENFEYVVVHSEKFGHLLLAKDLLVQFNNVVSENCKVLDTFKGKDVENTVCKHPLYDRESPIILGEHVTLETGTGCVHTAPGHGLEDFMVGHKYGLKVLSPVDDKGLFTSDAGSELQGLYVHKGGNQKVIELLLNSGALIKHEDYTHSYPYCWRSKTPIIFRATEQWFCSVEQFRRQALDEIDKVKWIPQIGRNRIYSMVETRTDWCISRQRVWGVPIPAFYCSTCHASHLNLEIIENFSKLVEISYDGTDVWWRKNTNELLPPNYKCSCGSSNFEKEKDTMDVWFDSGSTHFAIVDQRDELKGIKDVMYLEGSDQHRGWFQSSLLTSVAIKGKAPYTEVLTHGFVLDENGRKMSKSLGNVVDPEKVISEYGADILRLWVASTDYSSDMRIGQTMLKQLAEVYRNIRNTARFLLSNLYDFDLDIKKKISYESLWNIDKFILCRLFQLNKTIKDAFEKYEFYRYYQLLQNFCAVELSSFYFDLVKDRLYTSGKNSNSRRSVQYVLDEILNILIRMLCPVLPHLAEDIWKHMPYKQSAFDSVLCLDWALPSSIDESIDGLFQPILKIKSTVNKALEKARADKKIGKSLEAKIYFYFDKNDFGPKLFKTLNKFDKKELETIFIVSQVEINELGEKYKENKLDALSLESGESFTVVVTKALGEKCPRCWKYSIDVGQDTKHKSVCVACAVAVEEIS